MAANNLDPNELGKFDSGTWWDVPSDFTTLHRINPIRLSWINTMAPLAGTDLIDVGCGGGILTEAAARRGARALGIDLAPKTLACAELHALESQVSVRYECLSAEEAAKRYPGRFDRVTCMELLEHLPDPSSAILACGQLVRPDGWVFFSTLNRTTKAFVLGIMGAEYLLRLLPKGTHQYERFIKPSELAAIARRAHLDLAGLTGVGYNPFTQQFHRTNSIDVNYIAAFRRKS